MSNRNNKSKSPQLKKPIAFDKDLMKYLILQKITKPHPPAELITKTQPDEDSEVEDFKQEIEQKFRICKANKTYKFPREEEDLSSDQSLDSLSCVTIYHLNSNFVERLTDATQPHFLKALNERLSQLSEGSDTPPFKSAKQHNYAPLLKSSRYLVVANRMKKAGGVKSNLSNKSLTDGRLGINQQTVASQGRESQPREVSVSTKPPSNLGFRQTPTLSSEKKHTAKSKQIQQLLKIAQQKQISSFYKKTPQVNNNYVNISANFNNSVIIAGKRNVQEFRVKTECDEDVNLNQFQINPKQRPKVRESVKPKKIELSHGHKILNYTMDNHLLESLGISRNAKSQNKNYKP